MINKMYFDPRAPIFQRQINLSIVEKCIKKRKVMTFYRSGNGVNVEIGQECWKFYRGQKPF